MEGDDFMPSEEEEEEEAEDVRNLEIPTIPPYIHSSTECAHTNSPTATHPLFPLHCCS